MVPVLEIMLRDFGSDIRIIGDNKNMSYNFVGGANFYNPNVLSWEPIIEKFGITLQHIERQDDPCKTIHIKTHDDTPCVNINFSEQMVNYKNTKT